MCIRDRPEPGDVVVSFDKINELMNEKRQTARAEVEKEAQRCNSPFKPALRAKSSTSFLSLSADELDAGTFTAFHDRYVKLLDTRI